jgi:hypothetical protein
VVTSIVTRIRDGERQRAQLYLKSWDEINSEINQALVLFPADHWQPETDVFDIRRKNDRTALTEALSSLDSELRLAKDQLNSNGVLLSSYVKGYDQIHAHVGPENEVLSFEEDRIGKHREFVGSDALAVYLKDVELKITGDVVAKNVEIADCQGSDSPNPLHMAMIQDYLLKAHLIIYVISSRTGVRQADIRFLSIIKQMGIADNILFVCNCDLNEHDHPDDLIKLVDRIKEELSLIVSEPQLYTYSALFQLFELSETKLIERDKDRLNFWRRNEELVTFCVREHEQMHDALSLKLTRERSTLLLSNQIERLGIIVSQLNQWVRVNREVLRRDAGEVAKLVEGIGKHQGHIVQIESMIQSTLNGAVQKKKNDLKRQLDRFFDRHSGNVLKMVISFIRNYEADLNSYEDALAVSGFTQTMYQVFQGFKQSLDSFMAEKINPEIIRFIGQEEKDLVSYLQNVAAPFEAMVQNALMQYEESLAQFDSSAKVDQWVLDFSPDLESIKQAIGLSLQPATSNLRYSANIRTEAIARLGLYSFVNVIRKILKKPIGMEHAKEIRALKDGVRRIKRETERSLIAHFKDYQENIKFQYMLRLTDAIAERLYEALIGHFKGYLEDLKALMESIGDERGDKGELERSLSDLRQALIVLGDRIHSIRESIQAQSSGQLRDPAVDASSS